ncbi:MAG: ribonuclease III domain-containing protein [Pelagibacteraceae bacterium]
MDVISTIKKIKNFQESLEHDSFDKNNSNSIKPFQKYEFLGDRVLGLIISEYLIQKFKSNNLDEISRRFIYLVRTATLFKIFKNSNLHDLFKHKLDPQSYKNSVYADALESLIGFLYIEKGLDFTKKIVLELWKDELNTLPDKDPKTFIQEYSQKKFKTIPIYKVIQETGTKHKPIFKISLSLNELTVYASGVSKQKAEVAAAKKMAKLLENT